MRAEGVLRRKSLTRFASDLTGTGQSSCLVASRPDPSFCQEENTWISPAEIFTAYDA
jgi:hypothetical protein